MQHQLRRYLGFLRSNQPRFGAGICVDLVFVSSESLKWTLSFFHGQAADGRSTEHQVCTMVNLCRHCQSPPGPFFIIIANRHRVFIFFSWLIRSPILDLKASCRCCTFSFLTVNQERLLLVVALLFFFLLRSTLIYINKQKGYTKK